jgi:hypothetical protein
VRSGPGSRGSLPVAVQGEHGDVVVGAAGHDAREHPPGRTGDDLAAARPPWGDRGPASRSRCAAPTPSAPSSSPPARRADPFYDTIAPPISAFADQATVAPDMAVRQRLARPVGIHEDRDRIVRNPHDHVIQGLFAAGPALQAVLPRLSDAMARSRLLGVIGQVGERGKGIRTTIFDLHTIDSCGSEPSLRRRLLDVVVEVLDDGRGIDERGARSGLGNLGQRAAATAGAPRAASSRGRSGRAGRLGCAAESARVRGGRPGGAGEAGVTRRRPTVPRRSSGIRGRPVPS